MAFLWRRLLFFYWMFLLTSCDGFPSLDNITAVITQQNQLEKIKQQGFLIALTQFGESTYYEGADGFVGLEHDLVKLFAQHIGVSVRFVIPKSFSQMLKQITAGEADIAAAGLTITPQRQQQMRFAPSYQNITEQVIYRYGSSRPQNVEQLAKLGTLEVVKGSGHVGTLHKLKQQFPNLEWNTNARLDVGSLLYLVNEKIIDYTIVDSNQFALIDRYYPELSVVFDISKPRQLAWALPKIQDDSLYKEVVGFFKKIKQNKVLEQLIERYYGHIGNLDYFSKHAFYQHYKNRLPAYKKFFQQAGTKYNIDWRLLAAIGYQESHWLENATSFTGVQGIMMLTKDAASDLGVKDRVDSAQSINGGALYFRQRKNKMPKRILDPDRTWMALASYNIGSGHLEDARIITQKQGVSPDKWVHLKTRLPLLSQSKWHQKTRHGYARGHEAAHYVANIRNYYDLMIWIDKKNKINKSEIVKKLQPQYLSIINSAI